MDGARQVFGGGYFGVPDENLNTLSNKALSQHEVLKPTPIATPPSITTVVREALKNLPTNEPPSSPLNGEKPQPRQIAVMYERSFEAASRPDSPIPLNDLQGDAKTAHPQNNFLVTLYHQLKLLEFSPSFRLTNSFKLKMSSSFDHQKSRQSFEKCTDFIIEAMQEDAMTIVNHTLTGEIQVVELLISLGQSAWGQYLLTHHSTILEKYVKGLIDYIEKTLTSNQARFWNAKLQPLLYDCTLGVNNSNAVTKFLKELWKIPITTNERLTAQRRCQNVLSMLANLAMKIKEISLMSLEQYDLVKKDILKLTAEIDTLPQKKKEDYFDRFNMILEPLLDYKIWRIPQFRLQKELRTWELNDAIAPVLMHYLNSETTFCLRVNNFRKKRTWSNVKEPCTFFEALYEARALSTYDFDLLSSYWTPLAEKSLSLTIAFAQFHPEAETSNERKLQVLLLELHPASIRAYFTMLVEISQNHHRLTQILQRCYHHPIAKTLFDEFFETMPIAASFDDSETMVKNSVADCLIAPVKRLAEWPHLIGELHAKVTTPEGQAILRFYHSFFDIHTRLSVSGIY